MIAAAHVELSRQSRMSVHSPRPRQAPVRSGCETNFCRMDLFRLSPKSPDFNAAFRQMLPLVRLAKACVPELRTRGVQHNPHCCTTRGQFSRSACAKSPEKSAKPSVGDFCSSLLSSCADLSNTIDSARSRSACACAQAVVLSVVTRQILTRNGHEPTVGKCTPEVTSRQISGLDSGNGLGTPSTDAVVFTAVGMCLRRRDGAAT